MENIIYAGFWKRFAALIIDSILLSVVGFVVSFIAGFIFAMSYPMESSGEAVLSVLTSIIGLALNWVYFAAMESSKMQATLGKLALGIQVADLNGNRISFARATGRYFAKILSGLILGIGYLMAAFTKRKQALHDIIAECLVINRK